MHKGIPIADLMRQVVQDSRDKRDVIVPRGAMEVLHREPHALRGRKWDAIALAGVE